MSVPFSVCWHQFVVACLLMLLMLLLLYLTVAMFQVPVFELGLRRAFQVTIASSRFGGVDFGLATSPARSVRLHCPWGCNAFWMRSGDVSTFVEWCAADGAALEELEEMVAKGSRSNQ